MPDHSIHLDWPTLHRDCRVLAQRLIEADTWQGIVGIARGGLIPAAILAREMNIRLVDTVCISSYSHNQQGALDIIKSIDHDGSGLLVVDDLVDTGNTARAVREQLPNATLVAIYAKPAAKHLLDDYVTNIAQDTWIYFPWDLDEHKQFIEPIAGME